MKHKIWFDEENGVLREQIIGSLTREDIPEFLAQVDKHFKDKKHCLAIIDLSRATKQVYDKDARKLMAEESAKLGYNEKVAFVGASARVKMLAKVLIAGAKIAGKPITSRFFDTDAEALTWLKETIREFNLKADAATQGLDRSYGMVRGKEAIRLTISDQAPQEKAVGVEDLTASSDGEEPYYDFGDTGGPV